MKLEDIDLRANPEAWSVLASAIIARYHKDKKKNPDVYIDPEWYDDLYTLATRFSRISGQKKFDVMGNKKEVENYLKTHSLIESARKFGFSLEDMKKYIQENKIRRRKCRK